MTAPTPVGDLRRIVVLLTAIEGDNHRAVNGLLREFTQNDALRMGAMYVESIRQQAAERGVPMPVALQIFGRVAAQRAEDGAS